MLIPLTHTNLHAYHFRHSSTLTCFITTPSYPLQHYPISLHLISSNTSSFIATLLSSFTANAQPLHIVSYRISLTLYFFLTLHRFPYICFFFSNVYFHNRSLTCTLSSPLHSPSPHNYILCPWISYYFRYFFPNFQRFFQYHHECPSSSTNSNCQIFFLRFFSNNVTLLIKFFTSLWLPPLNYSEGIHHIEETHTD